MNIEELATKKNIIMIEFQAEIVSTILRSNPSCKITIFSSTSEVEGAEGVEDETRLEFERIHRQFPGRVTMYEGDIDALFDSYSKLHDGEYDTIIFPSKTA
jgi:hypothetical protein